MKLSEEERNLVVVHRLQKAKDTLREAKGNIDLGYWHTAANRLYYACYYATSALLIKYEHSPQTHSGVIGLFGEHFVSKGIVSNEAGKLYRKLFELRQTGDYNDWINIEAADIQPLVIPAEEYICLLEKLILTKPM
ncbi:MAG: hypothetical protein EZS26_000112 [Candidatus Ordinivivax streblomastigis]|uniref:HEPN domain-containing protein n=1 Tax=Candidatus Ordinivivax streblomastigis TaxID=2540710 RepID=A0A5M8P564_9BACT|nr:MAG: hypothetical protein EZS26_000112 [Candidatus Ordinivivax streblomastigis]